MQVNLPKKDQFYVEEKDILGFVNNDDVGVIGYHFEAVSLYHASPKNNMTVGAGFPFDVLMFPYKFAIGVSYIPGQCHTLPISVNE